MLIEQSMIFSLGFLVALLLVLLFLPAFWGRAIRLSMRKIGDRLPVSMAEVAAERDGLRAENAIVRRRLEQARDHAYAARDQERGNVGRLTTRLAATEIELEARVQDIATIDKTLSETQDALRQTEAELGTVRKDHYDASALLERAARDADAMRSEQQRLRDLADQRRITVSSLENRIRSMQGRIEDLEASLRDAEPVLTLGPFRSSYPAALSEDDARSGEVERLMATIAERDRTIHTSSVRYAELDTEFRRLDAETRMAAGSHPGGIGADGIGAEDIALLRKSICDVAADVVRLADQRGATPEAPNILQIRRLGAGRDATHKGQGGDPLQATSHGKSMGAKSS